MPLADPIGFLAAQRAEYDWDGRSALAFDDGYRARQLPLLGGRSRSDLRNEDLRDGEFWPPVRSVTVPIDSGRLLADPAFTEFLDALRDSDLAGDLWWDGLAARADRVHATLAPDIGAAVVDPQEEGPIVVTVRGPWVGRHNTGRIYLPVEVPSPADRRTLAAVRDRLGAEHRPLLAGYLQLRSELDCRRYERLRSVVREHQHRVAVPMAVDHLAVRATMDNLVLRSQITDRIRLGS
ncbi:hypothetical protein AB0M43_02720 [Longispora sp. NPDC051575]|uniref:hypothetical protein n=1 Tax=Longispora sp. NPDC051575 TaxID=3154943 RepID=UPI0034245803